MFFSPQVNETITIGDTSWRFAEHPAAPGGGIPHGQEGRAGIVFQLVNDAGDFRALKVFKQRFRQPSLVRQTRDLLRFADVPGLQVCRRQVLTPTTDAKLLQQYHDLSDRHGQRPGATCMKSAGI